MTHFDSYIKNVLDTLKVCGVPALAMKGCCDDDNLFPGSDLYESFAIAVSADILGHGDIYIFKGNNGEVKGVLLCKVSSKFLSIVKGNGMLYGARYKSLKSPYDNNYAFYF